jgi:hypothetical protein
MRPDLRGEGLARAICEIYGEAKLTEPYLLLERVMNLGKSRIEMRISRSAWSPRDLCFPHF